IEITFRMSRDAPRSFETFQLLRRNLFCMRAHDEMNLMRRTIDLLKQSLQINRSTGAGRSNHKFHRTKRMTSDQAGDNKERSPRRPRRFGNRSSLMRASLDFATRSLNLNAGRGNKIRKWLKNSYTLVIAWPILRRRSRFTKM